MDDRRSAAGATIVAFLNAAAFGILCPLFFYVFTLTDGTWMSIWIGVLIAIDSLGTIVGRLIFRKRDSIVVPQAIALLSFVLLACVGQLKTEHFAALTLVYVATLLRAIGTAKFPVLRFVVADSSELATASFAGFVVGCVLSITPANNRHVVESVLETGSMVTPAICGLILTAAALATAVITKARVATVVASPPPREPFTWLISESAFGMFICSAPLLGRETYTFTPAYVGLLLAVSGSIAAAARSIYRTRHSIRAGLLISAAGFAAFAVSWKVSWLTHPFDGMIAGYWILWTGAALAAAGYGMLQAASSNETESTAASLAIRLSIASPIISGLAALFSAAIWATHERSSYAIPAALAVAAFILSLLGN